MADFTIVDSSTGLVTRTGQCPDHALDLQPQAGEELVLGLFPQHMWHKKNGRMQLLPPKDRPLLVTPKPESMSERIDKLEQRIKQLEERYK